MSLLLSILLRSVMAAARSPLPARGGRGSGGGGGRGGGGGGGAGCGALVDVYLE